MCNSRGTRCVAQKTYIRFVKIARIAFKRDPGISTQLTLSGARKRTLSGWSAQATQFYKNALGNKAILTGLKEFGITEQKLKAGLAELDAIGAANLAQEKRKEMLRQPHKREMPPWMSCKIG